ncbi:MAG: prephenate dehydrogenase/arogenate dehydrogenase family protein, partial [bacterium]
TIVGVDEFSTIHRAMERGTINEGFNRAELDKAVNGSEIIFICTPVQQIFELLTIVAKAADEGTLVCDVGSSKERIVEEANKHFSENKYFLGTHPMTGAETRGIESADPFLFENAIWVITPGHRIPEKITRKLGLLLEGMGARILMLTPKMHDRIIAAVSHLPQFAAVSLVNLIARFYQEDPNYLKLAAGGFRDMTRIASSPFSLWRDVCKTNSEQIINFINEYIAELQRIKNLLQNQELESYFNQAAITRLAIPKDSKGFIRPQYDISIAVEDQPGIIARFSGVLAKNNINIKDIEVLKVREGEGGTIRLAFENEADRQKAVDLIREAGFSCYARD